LSRSAVTPVFPSRVVSLSLFFCLLHSRTNAVTHSLSFALPCTHRLGHAPNLYPPVFCTYTHTHVFFLSPPLSLSYTHNSTFRFTLTLSLTQGTPPSLPHSRPHLLTVTRPSTHSSTLSLVLTHVCSLTVFSQAFSLLFSLLLLLSLACAFSALPQSLPIPPSLSLDRSNHPPSFRVSLLCSFAPILLAYSFAVFASLVCFLLLVSLIHTNS